MDISKLDLLALARSTTASVVRVAAGLTDCPIAVITIPAAQADFGAIGSTIIVAKSVISLPTKLSTGVTVVVAIAQHSKPVRKSGNFPHMFQSVPVRGWKLNS